jgi:hypothetical protein
MMHDWVMTLLTGPTLSLQGIFVVLTFRGVALTFQRLKEVSGAPSFSDFQVVLSRAGCC